MILVVNSDRNSAANISSHYAHQGGELPACFRCLVVGPVNPTMSDVEQRAIPKKRNNAALWSHVWPIDVWTGILTELDILPMQSGNGIVEQECTRQWGVHLLAIQSQGTSSWKTFAQVEQSSILVLLASRWAYLEHKKRMATSTSTHSTWVPQWLGWWSVDLKLRRVCFCLIYMHFD